MLVNQRVSKKFHETHLKMSYSLVSLNVRKSQDRENCHIMRLQKVLLGFFYIPADR